jgi:hypothetical protein
LVWGFLYAESIDRRKIHTDHVKQMNPDLQAQGQDGQDHPSSVIMGQRQ